MPPRGTIRIIYWPYNGFIGTQHAGTYNVPHWGLFNISHHQTKTSRRCETRLSTYLCASDIWIRSHPADCTRAGVRWSQTGRWTSPNAMPSSRWSNGTNNWSRPRDSGSDVWSSVWKRSNCVRPSVDLDFAGKLDNVTEITHITHVSSILIHNSYIPSISEMSPDYVANRLVCWDHPNWYAMTARSRCAPNVPLNCTPTKL